MAKPTVLPGTKLLILVGDAASPEVFAGPCGLTTKSFDLNASSNTTLLPDCADESAPAWESRDVNALSARVTGSGVMAEESFEIWNDWFMGAVSKNIQVKLDSAALGHWSGAFVLSSLKFVGQRGTKVTVDITLDSDGAVGWTEAV